MQIQYFDFEMRYYEENIKCRLDYSELLRLMRGGYIYSLSIEEDIQGYFAQVEVVSRELGIQPIELFSSAHRTFATRAEVAGLLVKALHPIKPLVYEKHLAAREGTHTLCGELLESSKKGFKAVSVQDFYARNNGPQCSRCLTQAFVFGISKPQNDKVTDSSCNGRN